MKLKIAVLGLLLISMTSCLKIKTGGDVVLNPEKFEQKMNSEDVQLVDVRTPEEFEEGHLLDKYLPNNKEKMISQLLNK